jgi:hypothetical protein
MFPIKKKLVAGGVAALAVLGGGGAIAATQLDPKAESDAVVEDAAKQLGIEPSKLSAALKKALEDRVDAAVAAGRITKAEGDELKQRIESDDFPLFGGFHHGGPHGFFGGLDAAASYLGLTDAELRTQLESGKTLAQVADAHGKSVDGLIQALTDAAAKRLDAAVAAGRLTKEREQSILADLKQHITELVNGTARAPHFGYRPGFGGPPGADLPDA